MENQEHECKCGSTGKLAEALAKAQGEFPVIPKNRVTRIPGRPDYRYADLAEIIKCVQPALTKNGLALNQTLGGHGLTCRLMHSSGETLESSLPIQFEAYGKNPQGLGSVLTYYRRYTITALLSIAADDDDDAMAAQAQGRNQNQGAAQPARSAVPKPQAAAAKPKPTSGPADLGDYVIKAGKHTGKSLRSFREAELKTWVTEVRAWAAKHGKTIDGFLLEALERAEEYLPQVNGPDTSGEFDASNQTALPMGGQNG